MASRTLSETRITSAGRTHEHFRSFGFCDTHYLLIENEADEFKYFHRSARRLSSHQTMFPSRISPTLDSAQVTPTCSDSTFITHITLFGPSSTEEERNDKCTTIQNYLGLNKDQDTAKLMVMVTLCQEQIEAER